MPREITIESLSRQLNKVQGLLEKLLEEKKGANWVKVSHITKITGWNKEQMRRMRLNGIVKFKKTQSGIWYDLDSMHPTFLKQQRTVTQ
jgi:hypothetical protein